MFFFVSFFFFFFFSSRRRHTRYWRDWSSDVCSSDLVRAIILDVEAFDLDRPVGGEGVFEAATNRPAPEGVFLSHVEEWVPRNEVAERHAGSRTTGRHIDQIGRASCRERVEIRDVGGV